MRQRYRYWKGAAESRGMASGFPACQHVPRANNWHIRAASGPTRLPNRALLVPPMAHLVSGGSTCAPCS